MASDGPCGSQRSFTPRGLAARAGPAGGHADRRSRGDRVRPRCHAGFDSSLAWAKRLDRLLDAAHAALQEQAATRLVRLGTGSSAPKSASTTMETVGALTSSRSRPALGILMVVEIKSASSSTCRTPSAAFTSRRGSGSVLARDQVVIGSVGAVVPALVIRRHARRPTHRGAPRLAVSNRLRSPGTRHVRGCGDPPSPAPSGLLVVRGACRIHCRTACALPEPRS